MIQRIFFRSIITSFFFVLFEFVPMQDIAAGPVPDTGQTASYTATFGEDSDYTINPPSYTKLGENGEELPYTATQADGWIMTRDNVTGLIWEIKTNDDSIHDKDNAYTWCDTDPETNGGDPGTCEDGTDTEDFIEALNDENFGGFSDWRMPTRRELVTILNYDTHRPTIDEDFFPYVTNTFYWSSNTKVGYTSHAWGVHFFNANSYYSFKPYYHYVHAVRGGNIQSNFVNNGDGTITDTATGLMWQQEDDNVTRTWENALVYCENLTLAGYNDWRLPTIKELYSIVNLTAAPVIDPIFSGPIYSHYWSSTTDSNYTNRAFHMDWAYGNFWSKLKTNDLGVNVRAVRG